MLYIYLYSICLLFILCSLGGIYPVVILWFDILQYYCYYKCLIKFYFSINLLFFEYFQEKFDDDELNEMLEDLKTLKDFQWLLNCGYSCFKYFRSMIEAEGRRNYMIWRAGRNSYRAELFQIPKNFTYILFNNQYL